MLSKCELRDALTSLRTHGHFELAKAQHKSPEMSLSRKPRNRQSSDQNRLKKHRSIVTLYGVHNFPGIEIQNRLL